MTDQEFLAQAIEIGNEVPAPYNFGAVVVMHGKVIGKAHGDVQTTHNPSLHSEVCALAEAGKVLGNWQMDGVTLYCSHEPCVMCFSCAAWANVDRIVYATAAKDQHDFMYEFKGVSLDELTAKLRRPIVVEHLPSLQ
jgi:tRNA(Arg) A34 adenosine deaminase TadA